MPLSEERLTALRQSIKIHRDQLDNNFLVSDGRKTKKASLLGWLDWPFLFIYLFVNLFIYLFIIFIFIEPRSAISQYGIQACVEFRPVPCFFSVPWPYACQTTFFCRSRPQCEYSSEDDFISDIGTYASHKAAWISRSIFHPPLVAHDEPSILVFQACFFSFFFFLFLAQH